jgi:DNA-binding cell septation regulator SpoVG
MSNPSIAVEITPSTRPGTSQLASATVRLTTDLGPVTIHDVRVLRNKSGVAWIALPSYSVQQSSTARQYEYRPTVELSPELFEQISIEVLRTYRTSQNEIETKSQPQSGASNVQHPSR